MSSESNRDKAPVYRAVIIDQAVKIIDQADKTTEEARIILTVKRLLKLMNPEDPEEGTEACEQGEHEVWITIVGDDVGRLHMALRDLERLGFTDDDISRLHPEHPECFRLVDKHVYIRPATVGDVTYWNIAWPRPKPKAVGVADLQNLAASLKAKIAAVRSRKKGKGEPKE
jgi:hypothetical protein